MSTALQRLQFIIGMTNNVSGPLNQLNHSIDGTAAKIKGISGSSFSPAIFTQFSNAEQPVQMFTQAIAEAIEQIKDGAEDIVIGTASIWGALAAVDALTAPAEALNKSLREVSTMGVGDTGLDALSKSAINFTAEFGGAEDAIQTFVASAYDLKSGISSLNDNELADFTRISAMLALGTKSDTATITKYVGTMAGVFKTEMESMGKTKWIEALSGQTATAVQLFKTTGSGISQAFTSLGAAGSALKIGMAEQFAVIGSLSATMEGGMAGTKYKAFLKGIGHAQQEMGLSFADSKGKLLPIYEILGKIQNKYGGLSEVAQAGIFKKAFGSDEAVGLIQLLSKNLTGLKANISEIGKNSGMEKVIEMANKMADPQPWIALKTAASSVFFKIVDPIVNDNLDKLYTNIIRYIDLFPHLSRLIGEGVFAFIALGAAVGAFYLISGATSILIGGLSAAMATLAFVLIPLAPLFTAINVAWRLALMEFYAGGGVLAAMKVGLKSLTGSLWGTVRAMWAWTVALLANPVTWIVIAVVALGAAVIYASTQFDSFYDAMVTGAGYIIAFFSDLGSTIGGWIYDTTTAVGEAWSGMWESIKISASESWNQIVNYFQSNSLTQIFTDFKDYITNLHPLDALFGEIDSLMSKWNSISFSNPFAGLGSAIGGFATDAVRKSEAIQAGRIPVPGTGKTATTGGVSTVLNKSSSSNKTTVVNVNNNHKQPVTANHIAHALKMAAP